MVCYSNDGIVVRCFDVYNRYLLKWNSIEYQGILRMRENGGLPFFVFFNILFCVASSGICLFKVPKLSAIVKIMLLKERGQYSLLMPSLRAGDMKKPLKGSQMGLIQQSP